MRVRPGRERSYEEGLHDTCLERFFLAWRGDDSPEALRTPRVQRAIGAIYRPQTERQSHYFQCDVTRQFDALVHIDVTHAVRPLEPDPGEEIPERYPSGV